MWARMCEKVLYEELTPNEFCSRLAKAPIAYLPLGTLEWHGEHLPLGSDGIQSQGFFIELAQQAGGIVLPMLFLGPDRADMAQGKEFYGMDLYGFPAGKPQQLTGSAYWVSDALFEQILRAILKQLKRAGFRIVVAHGHGPSTRLFRDHIEEWSKMFGLELFVCRRKDESDGLGIQTDHAAVNEVSLMMTLRPELVQIENLSQDPEQWPIAIEGRDPRQYASPELGRKAIEMQVQRMTTLLKEVLSRVH
jgi:creatinine amidohydrolase